MSRNRNKKRLYRIQALAAQPVQGFTLEVTEGGEDEAESTPVDQSDLEKVGRRNNADDQQRIQEIAWNAEELGADLTRKRDGGKRMWVDAVAQKVEEFDAKPLEVWRSQEPDGNMGKGEGVTASAESGDSVLFIPITKVDVEKREIWGTAAHEIPDHAKEIMDYASSKPFFQRWSDDAKQRSGGKSLGNVRAMHNPIAAGKLIALSFDDASRRMMIGTKIVDDAEWKKAQEGVYTGFSIGGSYERRWLDKGGLTRYTANPREVSLVDAPCIPTATFDVVKGDEIIEVRKFKAATLADKSSDAQQAATDTPAEGDALAKQAGNAPVAGEVSAPDGPIAALPAVTPASTLELNPDSLPSTAALQQASNPDVAQLSGAGMSVEPAAAIAETGEPGSTAAKSEGSAATPETAMSAPLAETDDAAAKPQNEAEVLSKRLGISLKPSARQVVGNWRAYGDPVNGAFKVDSRLAALFAVGEYQAGTNRESYSPMEWAVIGRRLSRLAEAETGLPFVFDPRTRAIVVLGQGGAMKMDSKILQAVSDARVVLEGARSGGEYAPEAVEQAMALMDVALANATPTPAEPLVTPEAQPAADVAAVTKVESVEVAPADQPQQNNTVAQEDKMSDNPLTKNEPATAPAPQFFMAGIGNDYLNTQLPVFMAALEGQQMLKAYDAAGRSERTFDVLYKMAQQRILHEGGFTMENYKDGKLNKALPFGELLHRDALQKGINSSYAPNIYLQRLVRLMLPVANPLRSRFPSRPPQQGGASAQWRAELGFPSAFSFAAALYNVPEADVTTLGSTSGVGPTMTDTALSFTAPFKDIAVNDIVSLKSIAAMQGYDDPFQVALIKILSAALRIEELKILLDNSAAIANPGTVTNTGSGTGGTLAAATYTVRVTALTGIGWMLSTVAGFIGQAAQGESAPTASNAYVATGATSSLTVTWASVPGAVAYNVYVDNGTNNRYLGTVTAPRVVVTTMPGSGNAPPGAGNTANANGFESVLQWAMLSTIYGNSIPNKTFVEPTAASRALTLSGANSIAEFDTVLRQLYTTWKIAPTLILCSPRSAAYATKVVSNSASGPYRLEASQNQGEIIGGLFMGGYVNQFAPRLGNVARTIEMLGHPEMPDGTYAFLCESIPYPQARETNAFLLETLVPYTYFPLASTTLAYPFTLALSETLECYHPSAQSVVAGVDVSL